MEVGLLGPFQVLHEGEPLRLGGPRQRAVLAVLALDVNRAVPRDRLVQLIWGSEPPETASGVLQTYVSNLRSALDAHGIRGDEVLRSRAGGYELCLPEAAIDVNRFETAVRSARAALSAGDAARAEELFSDALGLWRGTALGEFATEAFGLGHARRFEELRLAAIEDRAEARLAQGKHNELVPELEGLLHEYPLRERMAGQLMLALYRSGRQAAASDVFQRTREKLVEEAGLEPGPDLQRLLLMVLRHDPHLNTGRPARSGRPESRIQHDLLRVGATDYPLTATAETLVGRRSVDGQVAPDIDLASVDHLRRVSRRHALLIRREGGVFVRDLGSLNGTTHNGTRLATGMDQPLQAGDRILFGGVPAVYLTSDDATQGTKGSQ